MANFPTHDDVAVLTKIALVVCLASQAPFSMANFPTLEDAAVAARSGKEREEAQALDGMLEAVQHLKISECEQAEVHSYCLPFL